MAPLRWPDIWHELALAKEVAKYFPKALRVGRTEVAKILSNAFSTGDKPIKGRGCREKMDKILEK